MHSVIVLMLCLRVNGLKREWWIDLPELNSIRLGESAFQFKYDDESTELIMRSGDDEMRWWIDLPKLTTLTTGKNSCSFNYPGVITLESISYHPILTNRHTLTHHCFSPSCIWIQTSIVPQEQSQLERVMNRCWRIHQTSCLCSQSSCEHSFFWRTKSNESKCGSDDCG